MSAVLILGRSGVGKSSSIRTLDSKETFIIQVIKKDLPFKEGRKGYSVENKNLFITDEYTKILGALKKIKEMPNIKTVILDDANFVLTNEFMKRSKEKGYEKYSELAEHFWQIINMINEDMRDDLDIFILSHSEENEFGEIKMKTIGKVLDEKIFIPSMFSIVLQADVIDDKYVFKTKGNGKDCTKSPMGMFDEEIINNDLLYVKNKISEYYK